MTDTPSRVTIVDVAPAPSTRSSKVNKSTINIIPQRKSSCRTVRLNVNLEGMYASSTGLPGLNETRMTTKENVAECNWTSTRNE